MRWLRNRSTKAFRSILLELRWKCRFGEVWVHLETRVLPSTERLAGQHIKPHLLLVLMCCLLFALLGSSLSNPTFPLHRPLPVVLWPDRPIALPRVGSFPSRAFRRFSAPRSMLVFRLPPFALSLLYLRFPSRRRIWQPPLSVPEGSASPPSLCLSLFSRSGFAAVPWSFLSLAPLPQRLSRLAPLASDSLTAARQGYNARLTQISPSCKCLVPRNQTNGPLAVPVVPLIPPAQRAPDTNPNPPRASGSDQK